MAVDEDRRGAQLAVEDVEAVQVAQPIEQLLQHPAQRRVERRRLQRRRRQPEAAEQRAAARPHPARLARGGDEVGERGDAQLLRQVEGARALLAPKEPKHVWVRVLILTEVHQLRLPRREQLRRRRRAAAAGGAAAAAGALGHDLDGGALPFVVAADHDGAGAATPQQLVRAQPQPPHPLLRPLGWLRRRRRRRLQQECAGRPCGGVEVAAARGGVGRLRRLRGVAPRRVEGARRAVGV